MCVLMPFPPVSPPPPPLQTASLEQYTEYAPEALWACVCAVARVHAAAPLNTLHAVRDKYSRSEYLAVSVVFSPVAPAALEAVRIALGVSSSAATAPLVTPPPAPVTVTATALPPVAV